MSIHLPAHPPFSLSAVVRSHGWWQLSPFSWDEAGNVLTRLERLSSRQVLELRIRESDGGVGVEVEGQLADAEWREVVDKMAWMLQLDLDLGVFYALVGDEPGLAHIEEGTCPSKVCKALIQYRIMPEACTGCGACLKVCPTEAITGEKKELHNIAQEKCIKCGMCYSTCRFDAIEVN